MRKVRLFTIIILLFVVAFNAFAASYNDSLKTSLEIEGFIAVYFKVNVTELEETGSLGYGMPFDITDDEVQYNSTDQNLGRLIAKWDFASTQSPVYLKITASPMTFDTDPTIKLQYYISFKYKYAMYNSDGSYASDNVGYILVDSENPMTDSVELKNTTADFPIVVSTQQDIRFMFKDGEDPTSSDYPAGYYSASITIEFTGV
jgi:hypothetical protein